MYAMSPPSRMSDARGEACLLEEPPHDVGARLVLGVEELQRDVAAERFVVGPEHRAEAALSELAPDDVLAESGAWDKHGSTFSCNGRA